MDDSEWTELTANIEEVIVVSVVRALVEGETGIGKLEKSNLDRLVDEGASLNDPNRGEKIHYWLW